MHESVKSADQKIAEAEIKRFRDALGPFVVAAETSKMAMIFTAATFDGNPIIFANDAYLGMTDSTREEVLGESFNAMNRRSVDAETFQAIMRAFKGDGAHVTEVMYRRKDDNVFWAALMISPVLDGAGDVVQHFCSFVDLNERKAQEATSKRLIQELNHRVKNTLATVQSIVAQALRLVEDRDALGEVIESRLAALSRSHDLLSRENWSGARLRDVIEEALDPFVGAAGLPARISITGPDVRLSPKAALALGIAFNELATNAVKYGALSTPYGNVHVDWTVAPGPEGSRLHLRWTEKDGPRIDPPTRRGFGVRMIENGLKHELRGASTIDFKTEGVVCAIEFTLEA